MIQIAKVSSLKWVSLSNLDKTQLITTYNKILNCNKLSKYNNNNNNNNNNNKKTL